MDRERCGHFLMRRLLEPCEPPEEDDCCSTTCGAASPFDVDASSAGALPATVASERSVACRLEFLRVGRRLCE